MSELAIEAPRFIVPGTRHYRLAVIGLCASGFSTFALLYCVQPLMPTFARVFHISPAASSLSLSVSTIVLTVSIFLSGIASERFGRKRIMALSMFGTGLLNLACAAAPGWHTLLLLRLLEGITAGGVPAVAMAYLAEEIEPAGLGSAMGVYVAGNALGGMVGRLLAGAVADIAGWRATFAVLAILGLIAALAFTRVLPESRNWRPSAGRDIAGHLQLFGLLLRRRRVALLLLVGFLIVGPFVTVYNYAGYRLSAAPYDLGQTAIGAIFLVYLFGIAGSTLSGRHAHRLGRAPTMALMIAIVIAGLLITLLEPLAAIIVGIALVTFGFFGTHVVASTWIGALGGRSKGHASALYLFSFYAGLSIHGAVGGWFWQRGGWPAVIAMAGSLALVTLLIALVLGALPPDRNEARA
jgi:YNFM family putative membrane transporter